MEFNVKVYKGYGRTEKNIVLSKELFNDINSRELVVDKENLSFRVPLLSDTKTYKITSIRAFYFSDSDNRLPVGVYKVIKSKDNYFISSEPLIIEQKQKVSKCSLIDRFGRDRCNICAKLIRVDEDYDRSLNIGPHHTRCLTKLKYKQIR